MRNVIQLWIMNTNLGTNIASNVFVLGGEK